MAPVTASALNTPELTHPTAKLLGAGAKLQATNVGAVRWTDGTGATFVECSTGVLTGTLVKNAGASVFITIESATFTSAGLQCSGFNGAGLTTVQANIGNGIPWCIFSNQASNDDEFKLDGGSCSEAPRTTTFVLETAAWGACKYEKEAGATRISGSYFTDTAIHANSDAVLQVPGSKFKREAGSNVNCPPETFLDMTMTFETNASMKEPLYFS